MICYAALAQKFGQTYKESELKGSRSLSRRLFNGTLQTCETLTLEPNGDVKCVLKTLDETLHITTPISAQH